MQSKRILISLAIVITFSVMSQMTAQGQVPSTRRTRRTGVNNSTRTNKKTQSKTTATGNIQENAQIALMREASVRTLERAPNLIPRPLDAFPTDRAFIGAAHRILPEAEFETVEEAVRALESLLVAEPDVTAVVTSTPTTGLKVRYRPVDGDGTFLDTTTNNLALPVKAKTYLFIATDSEGKEDQQRVACVRGCSVTFYPPFQ